MAGLGAAKTAWGTVPVVVAAAAGLERSGEGRRGATVWAPRSGLVAEASIPRRHRARRPIFGPARHWALSEPLA